MQELGLSFYVSWLATGWGVAWLALMLAYSPFADWVATRLVDKPPNLAAFQILQHSRSKLIVGIVAAWVLGGFLEELLFRGIFLQRIAALMSGWLFEPFAIAAAICITAIGAGLVHLYQGLRAGIIVAQLSALFGILFVLSGRNLWTVILCHGLYDTIAFIRFANKKSKYSKYDTE